MQINRLACALCAQRSLFFSSCFSQFILSIHSSVSIFHRFAWHRLFGSLSNFLSNRFPLDPLVLLENRIQMWMENTIFFILYIVDIIWWHRNASLVQCNNVNVCLCPFHSLFEETVIYVQCSTFSNRFYCKRRHFLHDKDICTY